MSSSHTVTEVTWDACDVTCRHVQRVAERAFWDALEEGLRASPPQWERLVVLLGEAREALADIIPEASQEGRHLRTSLAEKLDPVCTSSSSHPFQSTSTSWFAMNCC